MSLYSVFLKFCSHQSFGCPFGVLVSLVNVQQIKVRKRMYQRQESNPQTFSYPSCCLTILFAQDTGSFNHQRSKETLRNTPHGFHDHFGPSESLISTHGNQSILFSTKSFSIIYFVHKISKKLDQRRLTEYPFPGYSLSQRYQLEENFRAITVVVMQKNWK